ncbi:MAG: ribonuclease H-like domain-containing protein [Nitrospirae bacterium]|nr:ribonuclease H-like domain-containing protein [Nitrospirota bacterium]
MTAYRLSDTVKYPAYLDIETTGLSPYHSNLTVIGIHIENGCEDVIQIIGDDITASALIESVKNAGTLYTYNGSRFDLPFIKEKLNVDLTDFCPHNDLMYSCWRNNLRGGLKAVERQLGIERNLTDVDGWVAVQLWNSYKWNGCNASLNKLLEYNKEDVLNLKKLRALLKV